MIVDPDFLDHWRVGMVADAIGDPMAPIYILRLWAHCQERKAVRFVMPPAGVKAQCKCPADPLVFERALIDAGFLARDGDAIEVLGWAEKNAALIAAWENGAKGGRPKKNPAGTHGKPMGSPTATQPEPMGNPDETDKSREDKSREETHAPSNPEDGAAPTAAGRVCLAMRSMGLQGVNPGHPDLLALIEVGATDEEFAGAARTAVDRSKGFAYAIGMLKKQRQEAQAAKQTMAKGAMPTDRRSRQLATAAALMGATQASDSSNTIDMEPADVRHLPA